MAKNAAVIGYPIHHSKSPLIHNYWMERYNIDASYKAIEISPDNFTNDVRALINNENSAGFNITQPFKQDIIAYCEVLDESAAHIKAVNTVYKSAEGQIIGANTDAYGFWKNISVAVPNFSIKDQRVCVLGAGGAARAIIYALQQQGAGEILIANRSIDKAENLAREFGGKAIAWDQRSAMLANCKLLVNTTSLGMDGKAALDIDLSLLPVDAVVNDIVYAPLQTGLLQNAAKRGNKTVQGIGMLLYQAQRAFEYWYGILPEVDAVITKRVLK